MTLPLPKTRLTGFFLRSAEQQGKVRAALESPADPSDVVERGIALDIERHEFSPLPEDHSMRSIHGAWTAVSVKGQPERGVVLMVTQHHEGLQEHSPFRP